MAEQAIARNAKLQKIARSECLTCVSIRDAQLQFRFFGDVGDFGNFLLRVIRDEVFGFCVSEFER
jgi:hypothetical protein